MLPQRSASFKIQVITENDLQEAHGHYHLLKGNIHIPQNAYKTIGALEWATNHASQLALDQGINPKRVVIMNHPPIQQQEVSIKNFSIYQFCPKNSACYSPGE